MANPDKIRMLTFLESVQGSGSGYKPTVVNLFRIQDYFSQVGDGNITMHVTSEGEQVYSGKNVDQYSIGLGIKQKRGDEEIGEATGRIWANPPTLTNKEQENYTQYLRSANTMEMLRNTYLIGEDREGSEFFETFINKLRLDNNDHKAANKWNSFIETTIDDILTEYSNAFRSEEVFQNYLKQYGNDGFPGNLDLTLEVMRRVFEKYPKIFVQKDLPMSQTCMCWGIDCRDGWYDILDSLCKLIQHRVKYSKIKQVEAAQVKEKFGGLRFYIDNGDDYIYGLIDMASSISFKTCENCP